MRSARVSGASLPALLALLALLSSAAVVSLGAAVPADEVEALLRAATAPEACEAYRDSLLAPYHCTTSEQRARSGAVGREFRERAPANLVLEPIVVMPGLGGSGIEEKFRVKTAPFLCPRDSNGNWERLWLDLVALFMPSCWFDHLRLTQPAAGTYASPAGVQTRPIDFGGVHGIDYLDYAFGSGVSLTTYYADLINSFVSLGYQPGHNLRGLPYDWRYTPSLLSAQGLFDQIKALIEETSRNNGNQKVHFLAHSQGCLTSLAFLNWVSDAWKTQYISSWLPVAGPFGGAFKALRGALSGDSFGMAVGSFSLVNLDKMAAAIRTMPGVIYLAPSVELWGNTQIVHTPSRSYTASEIADLLGVVSSDARATYEHVKDEAGRLRAPNVKTYCLFGIGVPTEVGATYTSNNPSTGSQPTLLKTSLGDGTVPLESLRTCLDFAQQQDAEVILQEFTQQEHAGILKAPELINYVLCRITHTSDGAANPECSA